LIEDGSRGFGGGTLAEQAVIRRDWLSSALLEEECSFE
jgi:hypothetical protein